MDLVKQHLQGLAYGPVTQSGHLAVVPLLTREGAKSPPFYDTLKDAVGAGVARVTEISEGGSVPELLVVNEGPRPVLLVDGEELVGARQNRIVNITLLVPAHGKLHIPVSCVEAGRWSYRSREFAPADRAYHATGRRDKMSQVNLSMRTNASRSADQGAVWDEIASKSARFEAASETRAAAAMFESRHDDLERYVADLTPVPSQVGAVFLTRGRVAGVEVFDHPQSWARQMPMLVRSYGLDALDDALHGVLDGPAEVRRGGGVRRAHRPGRRADVRGDRARHGRALRGRHARGRRACRGEGARAPGGVPDGPRCGAVGTRRAALPAHS